MPCICLIYESEASLDSCNAAVKSPAQANQRAHLHIDWNMNRWEPFISCSAQDIWHFNSSLHQILSITFMGQLKCWGCRVQKMTLQAREMFLQCYGCGIKIVWCQIKVEPAISALAWRYLLREPVWNALILASWDLRQNPRIHLPWSVCTETFIYLNSRHRRLGVRVVGCVAEFSVAFLRGSNKISSQQDIHLMV